MEKFKEIKSNKRKIAFEDYIIQGSSYTLDDLILALKEVFNALSGDYDSMNSHAQITGDPSVMVSSNFNGVPLVSTRTDFFQGEYATTEKDCIRLWKDKPEMCEGMISLLKWAPSIGIPENQIWLGDVLFFEKNLRKEKLFNENFFTFCPINLKYIISEKDPISKKVKDSKIGIAWRVAYRGENLNNLSLFMDPTINNIKFVPEVFQLDGDIIDITGHSTLSEDETKEISKLLEKVDSRCDFIINQPQFQSIKLSKSFIKEIIDFKNYTKDMDVYSENDRWEKFNARGFKSFENNIFEKEKRKKKNDLKVKVIEEKRLEFGRIVNKNRDLLDAIFFLMKTVIRIKEILVKKIIKMGNIQEIKEYISRGFLPASEEGTALIKRGPNMALIVSVIPMEACDTTKILSRNWFNEDLSMLYEKIEPDNFNGGALESYPGVKKYLQNKIFPDNNLLLKKNLRSQKNIDLNVMPSKKELYRSQLYDDLKKYLEKFEGFKSYILGTTPVIEFKIEDCPKTVRLFLKPRWDQGMSALKTKKEEELQVVYLGEMQQARNEKREFKIDVDKEDLIDLGINESWLKSLENTSNTILNFLNEKFPGKDFIFSRGKYSSENIYPTMHELIDSLFSKISFYKGKSTKKDIWNPSDIYACDKNVYNNEFINSWKTLIESNEIQNLEDINKKLYMLYLRGDAIGFSLKKLKEGSVQGVCKPMGAFISESSKKLSKFQILGNKIFIPSFTLGNSLQNGIIFNTKSSFGVNDRWNYRLFGRNQLSLDINHGQAGKCPKYVLNKYFDKYGFAKFDTSKGFSSLYIDPSVKEDPGKSDYVYINKIQEINIKNLSKEAQIVENLAQRKGIMVKTADGQEFNPQNWEIFINNSISFLRNPLNYNSKIGDPRFEIAQDREFLVRDQILTMLKLLNFLKVFLTIMQEDLLWEKSMTELYLECNHDTDQNAPYIKII